MKIFWATAAIARGEVRSLPPIYYGESLLPRDIPGLLQSFAGQVL